MNNNFNNTLPMQVFGGIMLKLLGYDIFCNNLQCKKFLSEFGGIRGIINHLRYK